jgi:hypothetical protein
MFCAVFVNYEIDCFDFLDAVTELKIKEVLSKPYFHGFLNAGKAESMVKNMWSQISGSKVTCYLYRFSATEMGGFVLTYIDKSGAIYHKKIQRTLRGYRIDELRVEVPTFAKLHRTCKTAFKLKKHVPDSPYLALAKKISS